MNYKRFKQSKKFGEWIIQVRDFLRYAFTPSFGLIVLIGSLGALGIMAILLYRFQPLLTVIIFFSYTGFFSVAMIQSFIAWRKYKRHYNSVFK